LSARRSRMETSGRGSSRSPGTLNQHIVLLITPSVKFPSVTVSAPVPPLLYTHLCPRQESDTLLMSPFRAPQRDPCRAPPLPTCARRGLRKEKRAMATDDAEGLVAFQDVRVIRSTAPALMATDDAEGLVAFQDVRVIRSTAPALLCRIGERSVWLPRGQLSGKLWC